MAKRKAKPNKSTKPAKPATDAASTASAERCGDDTPAPPPALGGLKGLPRVVSVIVLLGVVLLIGVLFFRVMASFLVPLFLAAVLTVVFKPLHQWSLEKLPGRPRWAAVLTTALISLLVIVPTALLGWQAYAETSRIVRVALAGDPADDPLSDPLSGFAESPTPEAEAPAPSAGEASPAIADPGAEAVSEDGGDEPASWADRFRKQADELIGLYRKNINADFNPQAASAAFARYAAQNAVKLGLVGVQAVVGALFGLAIMIFALYYFLADGPSIIKTLMRLSPMDDEYERELLEQFSNVSRAVVLATILSAIVQGLLAGVGYYATLDSWTPPANAAAAEASGEEVAPTERIDPPIFLLTVLTMLLAIVPFVGATAVWIPVSLWIFFMQPDGFWPAIGLAIYGAAVVSSIDNVIKPYVLHGQSNLHPLLALLSVLGGIQLLGPIGILVGPMLVAFMQALLGMLRRELDNLHAEAAAG